MRKQDHEKLMGKALKTINFDKYVLIKLEEFCKRNNTTVSKFVNMVIGRSVMTETDFYREKAKQLHSEFMMYRYMIDEAESRKDITINKSNHNF
jgi:hypothetical protein